MTGTAAPHSASPAAPTAAATAADATVTTAAATPSALDHAGIAARIPHQGRMGLLHAMQDWSPEHVRCTAVSHLDPGNPLRTAGVLWSACAIEYASQAMALHGVLSAAAGAAPRAGFLASVRGVQLLVPRLDTVPGPLQVTAHRLAGDARQASYRFELHSEAGALLVAGRASVILDAMPGPAGP